MQNPEARQCRRRTELVRRITVAVEEGFEFFVFAEERIENLLCGQRRSHWDVTTAQALREAKEVRLNAFLVAGEQAG